MSKKHTKQVEVKKLQRKHARMVIGFLACAIFCSVIAMFTMGSNEILGGTAFLMFIGFAVLALYCRFHFLRCPVCHRGVAVASWSPKGRNSKCSVCKCDFIFDDDINIGHTLRR